MPQSRSPRTERGLNVNNEPFVITISHQVGSGGTNLGKKLSERLAIPFVDREILKRVAQQLNVPEPEVESREERLSSFWESFSRALLFTDPSMSFSQSTFMPSDKELFDLESDYIGRIAQTKSAIILGRCGRYILRDHPHRISILVHAAMPARIKRVSELYHLPADEAEKYIEVNDKERTDYIHTFTRQNWLDARLYDLCINTSSIGFDDIVALVMAFVEAKLH